jgi:hypothetical protein
MKQFNEVLFGPVTLLEKEDQTKKDVLGSVTVPFIVCDVKNANGRSYPAGIVKNELARVQKRLKEGVYPFGSAEHPEGPEVKIGDISHRITDVWFDEKMKRAMAKLEILNTTKGRDLAVVLRKGKIGVSARGTGNTKAGLVSDQEVCQDYQLRGVDFTLSPSFEECTAGGLVFESAEFAEASEVPRLPCGEPSDLECRIAGVPVGHHYQDPVPKKVLSESVVAEELTDEEVKQILDGMSDEEIEVLANMPEEETERILSMSDDEFDAYVASMEDVDEEVGSMRLALQAAVREKYDPDIVVRDFSNTEVIIQKFDFDKVTMRTKDILLKMDYTIDPDTDEIILDLNSAQIIQATDYVPLVPEQILDNPQTLSEAFQSLDSMIRAAIKNELGEGAWVKDFSESTIIFTLASSTIGIPPTPDILFSVDYQVTADGTIEFTSEPVVVKSEQDYVAVTEDYKVFKKNLEILTTPKSEELRFGQLSEQEYRLSGAKSFFGKPKPLNLSEIEYRYLSPKEAALLREEKFGKKK